MNNKRFDDMDFDMSVTQILESLEKRLKDAEEKDIDIKKMSANKNDSDDNTNVDVVDEEKHNPFDYRRNKNEKIERDIIKDNKEKIDTVLNNMKINDNSKSDSKVIDIASKLKEKSENFEEKPVHKNNTFGNDKTFETSDIGNNINDKEIKKEIFKTSGINNSINDNKTKKEVFATIDMMSNNIIDEEFDDDFNFDDIIELIPKGDIEIVDNKIADYSNDDINVLKTNDVKKQQNNDISYQNNPIDREDIKKKLHLFMEQEEKESSSIRNANIPYNNKIENFNTDNENKEVITDVESEVAEIHIYDDDIDMIDKVIDDKEVIDKEKDEFDKKSKYDKKFATFFNSDKSKNFDFEDEQTITQLKIDLNSDIEKERRESRNKLKEEYLKLRERRKNRVKGFNLMGRNQDYEDSLDDEKTPLEEPLENNNVIEVAIEDNYISEENITDIVKEDVFIDTNVDNDKVVTDKNSKEKTTKNIFDYDNNTQKDDIIAYLNLQKKGMFVKYILFMLFFAVSSVVAYMSYMEIGKIPFLDIKQNPRNIVLLVGLMLLTTTVLNIEYLFYGIINIFKKKADSDSVISIGIIFNVFAFILCIYDPTQIRGSFIIISTTLIILCSALNIRMKDTSISRIIDNMEIISSNDEKTVFTQLKNKILVSQVTAKLTPDDYIVGMKDTRVNIKDFLRHSFSFDYYDKVAKVLTYISILVGVILTGVLSFYFTENIATTIINIAVSTTLLIPVNALYTVPLILKKLHFKSDVDSHCICSYKSIENMSKTNCLIIDDSFIFDKEHVSITGIKTFDDARIDNIIVYVSSILEKNHCALSSVFLNVIEYNKSFLLDVKEFKYENAMGYSALVDGKMVLVGNRNLLVNHSVSVLKDSVENSFLDENKSVMYVAIDNKVAAVFILNYEKNEKVERYLNKLIKNDITVAVKVSDPCVTPEKIDNIYNYPKEGITLINSEIYGEINDVENQKTFSGDFVFSGDNYKYIQMVNESRDIISIIKSSITIQVLISISLFFIYISTSIIFNLQILDINMIIVFTLVSYLSSILPQAFIPTPKREGNKLSNVKEKTKNVDNNKKEQNKDNKDINNEI